GATGAQGAQGIQGPAGATGPQGLLGPQGPAGPQGSAGAQGQGFTWLGTWIGTTTYVPYNVVGRNGSSYQCVATNINTDPATDNGSHWQIIAQIGATGPQGTQGSTGPTGNLGPMGPKGPTGPRGTQGPQGPPVAAFSTTTAASWTITAGSNPITFTTTTGLVAGVTLFINGAGYFKVVSVDSPTQIHATDAGVSGNASPGTVVPSGSPILGTGPQGPIGATGPAGSTGPAGPTGSNGAAATIAAGTTTTGTPGTNASVTNVGSSSAAIFNFTIPAGVAGATGPAGSQGPAGGAGPTGPVGAQGQGYNWRGP